MVKNNFSDLLTLSDLSSEQLQRLISLSAEKKKEFQLKGANRLLEGRTGIMLFEKPSLRTRVTFEVAMVQLGGHMIQLQPEHVSLGKRETVKDAAYNLSRWVDCIVARTFSHELLVELAQHASVPVINALTDLHHPCQALALALTLKEKRGELKGLNLVFVGDGNNVANSLAELCGHLGMNFILACPSGFEMPERVIEQIQPLFKKHGGRFETNHDPKLAVRNADLIYTDVWVSMGQESESEQKKAHFLPFQVNNDLLKQAPQHCLVTHCLPAHRGEEITDEVMDSPQSICFDEAENRLHAQKAVLMALLVPGMLS